MTIFELLQHFWLSILIAGSCPLIAIVHTWYRLSECDGILKDTVEREQNSLYAKVIK